jgi:hypothetical protein
MSDFLDGIIKHVRDYDASRPRSLQAEPGWSEVGGCRSYLGFRLEGAWDSDETDGWGAVRGTAVHKYLETIFEGIPGFRTEVTTSYRGIPGHADLVLIDDTSVTDWKTTKLVNSRLWQSSPEVLWEKRVQANGYAAGLIGSGELPAGAIVRIAVLPVDGTYADWWCWEEPFDRAIADWGADRLEQVRSDLAAGTPLPKDKPYAYCREWCSFFSLCRAQDDPDVTEEITDAEYAAAIAAYGEAAQTVTALGKEKDRLSEMIRGLRGTAGDWRISMTREGAPKAVLDEEKVRADYAARGEPIPETWRPGSAPRLNVTRIKKKAGAA